MKVLVVTGVIVFVSVIMEIALLHYSATKGKLPFKIQLLPNLFGGR